jgi:hypothetical protein
MLQEETMPAKGHEEKVRINRILMFDEAIRSGSYPSITKLARKVEVTTRTIERDIALTGRHFTIPSGFKPEDCFDKEMGVFASRLDDLLYIKRPVDILPFVPDCGWNYGEKGATTEPAKFGGIHG